MSKDKFFYERIRKIFFLDPSFKETDLDWSMTIFKKTKEQFRKYIKFYKKNLRKIFPLGLNNKNSRIDEIIKKMKNFNDEVLFKLNRESVKIIIQKKLVNIFNNTKKFYLFPYKKRLQQKRKNKKYYIKNSKHYVFLDNPKQTYSIIAKNG